MTGRTPSPKVPTGGQILPTVAELIAKAARRRQHHPAKPSRLFGTDWD